MAENSEMTAHIGQSRGTNESTMQEVPAVAPSEENEQPGSSSDTSNGFEKMYFNFGATKPITANSWSESARFGLDMGAQAATMIAGITGGSGSSAFNGIGEAVVRELQNEYHLVRMKKQLETHLEKYEYAGLLEKRELIEDGTATAWTTTLKFHEADFLSLVYGDIKQYVQDEGISSVELKKLGFAVDITVHREKEFPDPTTQLYKCCRATGVSNVTQGFLAAHADQIPPAKTASVALGNALYAEGACNVEQRQGATANGEGVKVPLVLGRVLVLAALCGIRSMQMSDVGTILTKAELFESVMRSRIGNLRNHHASRIINTQLFGGLTVAYGSVLLDQGPSDRIIVGVLETAKKAKFIEPWKSCQCMFQVREKIKQPPGTPIHMSAGWAQLLHQRDACSKPLYFTIDVTERGNLVAQPSGNSHWFRFPDRSNGPAPERHYGGLIGQNARCGCAPTSSTSTLPKWKLGESLTIRKTKSPTRLLRHAQTVSVGELELLDCRGDWPMGVFLMQALARSEYVQGRGECANCAVRNAANVGCVEVIICRIDGNS